MIACLLLLYAIYDGQTHLRYISNILFLVGMIMFLVSLMTVTNAGKLFRSVRYTIGNLLNKGRKTELSFYDYSLEKDENKKKGSSTTVLIIGLIYIVLSYYIAIFMV